MAVAAPEQVELAISGMTCASCASRIERKLNKLDGVEATVNYATEEAAVSFDSRTADLAKIVAAVEAVGYGASRSADEAERSIESSALARRLTVAVALSAPLVLVAMISPLQFSGWEWLALALATPVVFWSGFRFHRAALANVRHGGTALATFGRKRHCRWERGGRGFRCHRGV